MPDSRIEADSRLSADDLHLAYDDREVVSGLHVTVPHGQITVIVGPNACGKSTLLRALGRQIRPKSGQVLLDGGDVRSWSSRSFARTIAMLPQSPVAPEGITVLDLVSRGRYAHESWMRQRDLEGEEAVIRALVATGTYDLATRPVDELSGGQRQRVWVALVIAQDPPILLLDEPTTFLDLAHQLEVLDILVDLNRSDDRTVVAVLHDLNHAARYAHHLIAMKDGVIVARGSPDQVITEDLVLEVFGLESRVVPDPVTGSPLVCPIGRHLGMSTTRPSHTEGAPR